jgi:molybdopterin adenylyltransferase
MAQIIAVCTSKNKGERKQDVGEGRLCPGMGLEGDAHAGFMHRQVSLLALESIRKMQAQGLKVGPGDFAENLTTEGIDLTALPVGTRLKAGTEAILRVTQIGKECHHPCAIYYQTGDCVMPREGIFSEVLAGGKVINGDTLKILPSYRFGVVTSSDKGSRGERNDESGPLIAELLKPWGDLVDYRVVPDEKAMMTSALIEMADEKGLAMVITTGGTGFSPRDVTPEATLEVVERLVPGIPEAMRAVSMAKSPRAMLSRGVAGIRKHCLIINLPGSPRAVQENLEVFLPQIEHCLEVLSGRGGDCASS